MITVAFSSHRLEAISLAERLMQGHRVVVLEEPPDPKLPEVLSGNSDPDEYLLDRESAFPKFIRESLTVLTRLFRAGVEVLQVEPYLERLVSIHEMFADGLPNERVLSDPVLRPVYLAEKEATGALLAYYEASLTARFTELAEHVTRFAKKDADRIRLRDELRASAIAELDNPEKRIYVEAGYIHRWLVLALKRLKRDVTPVFVLREPTRRFIGRRQNLGPGDFLTLNYVFRGRIGPQKELLLAGRSLVYIKLLKKEEEPPGREPFPHTRDETAASSLVSLLTFEDCLALYPKVRGLKREEALELTTRYLERAGRLRGGSPLQ